MTNTLAYLVTELITAVKKFIAQISGGANGIKLNQLTITLFGKISGRVEKTLEKSSVNFFESQKLDAVHRPVHVVPDALEKKQQNLTF
jgi:starvation-inducible outer membrane lipoprotein